MAPVTAVVGFTPWREGFLAALEEGRDSVVECGTCTACCRSSQFVHIEPDEVVTLAHIPDELLFPAPGQPPGHWVMGYDQDGCCPMLVDDACSIYDVRPRTCRVYDCRLFAALGRVNEDTPLIAARIRSWDFDYPDEDTRLLAERIRAEGRLPVDG